MAAVKELVRKVIAENNVMVSTSQSLYVFPVLGSIFLLPISRALFCMVTFFFFMLFCLSLFRSCFILLSDIQQILVPVSSFSSDI